VYTLTDIKRKSATLGLSDSSGVGEASREDGAVEYETPLSSMGLNPAPLQNENQCSSTVHGRSPFQVLNDGSESSRVFEKIVEELVKLKRKPPETPVSDAGTPLIRLRKMVSHNKMVTESIPVATSSTSATIHPGDIESSNRSTHDRLQPQEPEVYLLDSSFIVYRI